MAGNPQAQLAPLNRIRGAVNFASNPGLNITAPFLGREGINLAFDSHFGQRIGAMTGGVNSPEVYVMATIQVHILKSFANMYKTQSELLNLLGDATVIPDQANLANYQISNVQMLGLGPGPLNGTTADCVLVLQGDYLVNSQLFDQ